MIKWILYFVIQFDNPCGRHHEQPLIQFCQLGVTGYRKMSNTYMMLYNLVQTIFRSLRATKSHVKTRIMQTTAVVARITKFQSKSDRKSFPSNSRSLFNIFKLCGFDFRGLFYIYLKFHFAVYPTFNIISPPFLNQFQSNFAHYFSWNNPNQKKRTKPN